MRIVRSLAALTSIAALGLSGCAAPPPEPPPDPMVQWYSDVEAKHRASGRMKTDRLARGVPLTPETLTDSFAKIAFGEEFQLASDVTFPGLGLGKDHLRKWTGPVRYELSDRANVRDARHVADLMKRLEQRTGLSIAPATDQVPNMFIRILSEQDRQRVANDLLSREEPSILADLFFSWAVTPEWSCAAEFYFLGPTSSTRFEIGLAVIYIRDEVRGLSRQACIEEEISQSLGLARDDPSVRPSIFNDDEEYALLTRHDELLLQILYDPALAPGMDRETAMPIVRRVARKVIE